MKLPADGHQICPTRFRLASPRPAVEAPPGVRLAVLKGHGRAGCPARGSRLRLPDIRVGGYQARDACPAFRRQVAIETLATDARDGLGRGLKMRAFPVLASMWQMRSEALAGIGSQREGSSGSSSSPTAGWWMSFHAGGVDPDVVGGPSDAALVAEGGQLPIRSESPRSLGSRLDSARNTATALAI